MAIRAFKPFYELQQRQRFLPDWRGIFVNPYFILRSGLLGHISRYADQPGRLLDLGCGISPYRSLFKSVDEYVRMDIEFSHTPHEEIVFFDGRTIPARDEVFDCVLCTEVLEHAPDLDRIVDEIRRVLKPGGRALVTMPFMWEEHGYPDDFRRLTLGGAETVFKSKGFEILAANRIGRFTLTRAQIRANEIVRLWAGAHPLVQMLLCAAFISPITLTSLAWARLFPGSESFYLNIFLCLRKPSDSPPQRP